MPQKACQLASNINTGAYKELDAAITELALLNMTNPSGGNVNIVFGADSAAAAAAEQSAGRYYILTFGTTPTSMLNNVRCVPSRTWIRSADGTARTVNFNMAW